MAHPLVLNKQSITMRRLSIFLSFMFFFMVSALHAWQKDSIFISVNGQQRNMIVFTPNSVTKTSNMPLMIVTHGMNQDPHYQYTNDRYWAMIDTEKFIVAYLRSDGNTWDTGGTKDQNFVLQTIDEMYTRYGINKNRVYWSGFSMGSMLMYHCMPNVQDKIAAFGPMSGVQLGGDRRPLKEYLNCKKPVNLCHCHGTSDTVFGYEDYTIHSYVEGVATDVNDYKDYKKTTSGNTKEVWSGGTKGGEVELYTTGIGHWPSSTHAQEIWNFCKRFSLATVEEEFMATYQRASNLITEWQDTPEMASQAVYSSMQTALETYSPEKMDTNTKRASATKKLETYISAFEKRLETVLIQKSSAKIEQPTEFDPNFHIYLCFGQSNMEGNAAIETQDRKYVDPRFKMMAAVDMPTYDRQKGQWYPAYPPLCRDQTGLTPADYFGRRMVELMPEEVSIGVINVAVGGAAIELFDEDACAAYIADQPTWFQSYCKAYNNNPYRTLINLAKEAQKVGVIKGILLHQGCSNNSQKDWPVKVKRVYLRMLKDLGLNEEETPLLIGELLQQDKGGVCWGHNSVIANTQPVIPNSYVVSSAKCPGASDGLHFTAEGYRMIGKNYAEKMYKVLDTTKQIDFDTSEGYFPFTNEAFNQSLYLTGEFKKVSTLGTFKGEDNGHFGGWRYSKGVDFSQYNYLVLNMQKKASCKPVVKVFDTDDYLNPCYSYELGTNTHAQIDLHQMKTPDGKEVDPSHIYMVGLQTDASQTVYIKEVFLSMDGDTPVTGIGGVKADTQKASATYYDLTGRRVTRPTRGFYIQAGRKVYMN